MWSFVSTNHYPQHYETVSDLVPYVNIDSSWDYGVGNLEALRIAEGLDARPLSETPKPIITQNGDIITNPPEEDYDVNKVEEWRLQAQGVDLSVTGKLMLQRAQSRERLDDKKRQRILNNRIPTALPHQEALPAPDNKTKFIKKKADGTETKEKPTAIETKKKKKTYKRNWAQYNEGQYKEFEYFGLYASQLAETIADSKRAKTGRKLIEFRDLITSALIMSHANLSGRRAQSVLHEAWLHKYIKTVPSPSKMWSFMKSEQLTLMLHALVIISATPLNCAETCLAVDASGFRTTSYSDWFGEKHKYAKYNEWLKLHIICGVATHVIANAVVTPKDVGDNVEFLPLLDGVLKYFKVKKVVADKGYLARENYSMCAHNDIQLFVPFKSNSTGKARGSYAWAEAYAYAMSNPDAFMEEYHIRSNVETVFHMMKATQGETIRSRLPLTQKNELYLKVIVHNIRMLIMAFARMKCLPEFKPLLPE